MAINSDFMIENKSSITTSTAIQGKSTNDMSMDDFFNLLVAEMTNQDMFAGGSEGGGGSNNSNMVAQMAQFSTLQGMKTIQEYQQSAYAISYVGKDVTIANINETTGKIETIKGTVQNVTFYDGKPQVVVNGTTYPLHTVMEVNASVNAGNALNQTASYIGKTVTLTAEDEEGMPYDLTGVVGSVTLKGGQPYVIIGGKEYLASSITEVKATAEKSGETDNTGGTDDTSGTGGTEDDGDSGYDTDPEE